MILLANFPHSTLYLRNIKDESLRKPAEPEAPFHQYFTLNVGLSSGRDRRRS